MKIQDALDMVPEILAYSSKEHGDAIFKLVQTLENYKRMNEDLRKELNRCQRQIKQLQQ